MPKAQKQKSQQAPAYHPYAPPPPAAVKQTPLVAGKAYEQKASGYVVQYEPDEKRINIIYHPSGQGPKTLPIDTRNFYYVDPATNKIKKNDKDGDHDEAFIEAQRVTRLLDIKKDAKIGNSVVAQVCDLVYEDICQDQQLPITLAQLEETILSENEYRITRVPLVQPLGGGKEHLEHRMPRRQAFQEAGFHPASFIEDPVLVHNIANQVIDPADRKDPAPGSVFFPKPGENLILDKSFLTLFGFPDCILESNRLSAKEHTFRLTMNQLDPEKALQISSAHPYLPRPPYVHTKEDGTKTDVHFFAGNSIKNACIKKFMSTPGSARFLSALLNAKEMGDVFQVLLAFVYEKLYPQKHPIIVTNDMVVFCLSLMINMNCIYTKFDYEKDATWASVFDQKTNKVIVEYFLRKTTEILNHNHAVLEELKLTDKEEDRPLVLTPGPNSSLVDTINLVDREARVHPQQWAGAESPPLSIDQPVWYSVFTSSGVKVVHRWFIDRLYEDSMRIQYAMARRIREKAEELFERIRPTGTQDPKRDVDGYDPDAHKDIIQFIKGELRPHYQLYKIMKKTGRRKIPFAGKCHFVFPGHSYKTYTASPPPAEVLAGMTFSGGDYFNTLLLEHELVMTIFKTPQKRSVDTNRRLKQEDIKHTAVQGDGPVIVWKELPDIIRGPFAPFLEDEKKGDMQDGGGASAHRSSRMPSHRTSSHRLSKRLSSHRLSKRLSSHRLSSHSHRSTRLSKHRSSLSRNNTLLGEYFDFSPVLYDYSPCEEDPFVESLKKHTPSLRSYKEPSDEGLYRIDIHAVLKEQVYTYLYKNYDPQIIREYEIDILSRMYEDFDIQGHTLFNRGLERLLEQIMKKHVLPARQALQAAMAKREAQEKRMSRALSKHLSRALSEQPLSERSSRRLSEKPSSKRMSRRRSRRPASSKPASSKPASAPLSTRRRPRRPLSTIREESQSIEA